MEKGRDRDHEAHEAATLLRLAARTPEEEAYFRGYGNGIARRLSGGEGDGYEVRAMEILQSAADIPTRAPRAGLPGRTRGGTLAICKQLHSEAATLRP
jgi:hypothetical protein